MGVHVRGFCRATRPVFGCRAGAVCVSPCGETSPRAAERPATLRVCSWAVSCVRVFARGGGGRRTSVSPTKGLAESVLRREVQRVPIGGNAYVQVRSGSRAPKGARRIGFTRSLSHTTALISIVRRRHARLPRLLVDLERTPALPGRVFPAAQRGTCHALSRCDVLRDKPNATRRSLDKVV